MISAAHMHYQDPENKDYREAEIFHLSRATRGLSKALMTNLTVAKAEAIFACSVLLYKQTWTSAGSDDDQLKSDDLEMDLMVPLGTGLKDILFNRPIWPFLWTS